MCVYLKNKLRRKVRKKKNTSVNYGWKVCVFLISVRVICTEDKDVCLKDSQHIAISSLHHGAAFSASFIWLSY